MDKYKKAVLEAKSYLKKQSRDISHDLKHHEQVWENCKLLIKEEGLKVNEKLLWVAAFWHDVVVDGEKWPSRLMVGDTCTHLAAFLPTLKFSEKELQVVINTIFRHEFRDTPLTIEGFVLQDADKLDALSVDRWDRTFKEYEKGRLEEEKLRAYMSTFTKWAPIISSTFHYKFSRKTAEKNIDTFWEDKKWRDIFRKFSLEKEYQNAKSNKKSIKTIFLRIFIRIKNLTNRHLVLLGVRRLRTF